MTHSFETNISSQEPTPVLVVTDAGRDVDDIEALAYLEGSARTELAGIITTHMIPDRRAFIVRAFMSNLGNTDVPIGIGSVFPMAEGVESLETYQREHAIDGTTYEGEGLVETFPGAEEIIFRSFARHGNKLKIAALAPLTDLALFDRKNPGILETCGGIYIQGQAHVSEENQLIPDVQAYNLDQDREAAEAVFRLQNNVPFTLVGKHAAYQVPLLRKDFDIFEATETVAGQYLKRHAIRGIECFAERAPDVFRRVFKIEPDTIASLQDLSKPYDALVAMAIANPSNFSPLYIGRHSLIGMTPEAPGITDAHDVKTEIVNTILKAINTSTT